MNHKIYSRGGSLHPLSTDVTMLGGLVSVNNHSVPNREAISPITIVEDEYDNETGSVNRIDGSSGTTSSFANDIAFS